MTERAATLNDQECGEALQIAGGNEAMAMLLDRPRMDADDDDELRASDGEIAGIAFRDAMALAELGLSLSLTEASNAD